MLPTLGPEEKYGTVYFIGHHSEGPVKIGFTASHNVTRRLCQLQTGSHKELKLLGSISAYASIERVLHNFLKPHVVRGEWFEREPSMLLLARFKDSSYEPSDFIQRFIFFVSDKFQIETDSEESLEARVANDLLSDWIQQLRNVNTVIALPFKAWLFTQKDVNSAIGDLGTDAVRDPLFPPVGTFYEYMNYITQRTNNPAVTRTLIDAWIECDHAIHRLRYKDYEFFDWGKSF